MQPNKTDQENTQYIRCIYIIGPDLKLWTRLGLGPLKWESPKANSETMMKSLLCRGPQMWMNLEDYVKSSRTMSLFKRRTKQSL